MITHVVIVVRVIVRGPNIVTPVSAVAGVIGGPAVAPSQSAAELGEMGVDTTGLEVGLSNHAPTRTYGKCNRSQLLCFIEYTFAPFQLYLWFKAFFYCF